MSTHLITGFAGKEHITSADQGSFNAAVMGGGEFALERGEQFRCQVISNNKVRIYDGDAMMQGRHIIIDRNTYEETTHDNGTQGYKRIDLIVLTYEKNTVTSVETVKLEVIKGAPAEINPSVPEYTKGDILNSGAAKNQMPLYQIPFDGLSIGEPVKLFSTVPTLETMKKEVDEEVDAKKEEIDNKFKSMISSNADDWGMIENYGEFAADAKTVNESLGGLLKVVIGTNAEAITVSGDSYKTVNFTMDEPSGYTRIGIIGLTTSNGKIIVSSFGANTAGGSSANMTAYNPTTDAITLAKGKVFARFLYVKNIS